MRIAMAEQKEEQSLSGQWLSSQNTVNSSLKKRKAGYPITAECEMLY
jgi:hypothetical protein